LFAKPIELSRKVSITACDELSRLQAARSIPTSNCVD